jgi:hypothetical protein
MTNNVYANMADEINDSDACHYKDTPPVERS